MATVSEREDLRNRVLICDFQMPDGTICGRECIGTQGLGAHMRTHREEKEGQTRTRPTPPTKTIEKPIETPELDAEIKAIVQPLEDRIERLIQEKAQLMTAINVIEHSITKLRRVLRQADPVKYGDASRPPGPRPTQSSKINRFSEDTLQRAIEIVKNFKGNQFDASELGAPLALHTKTVNALIYELRNRGLVRLVGQRDDGTRLYVTHTTNGESDGS